MSRMGETRGHARPPATARPLDARLARYLIRPLQNTPATPNHLTTLRLALGLVSAAFLAVGSLSMANIGAFFFVLSNFVDHTDGELARISGNSSRLGHWYDLASDLVIHVLLFTALGYGLRDSQLGNTAAWLGLIAGAAVAFIFWFHMSMEAQMGKSEARLPGAGLFEIEDILYLFPLVTLFDMRIPFLLAAVVGAPAFALWLIVYARQVRTQGAG